VLAFTARRCWASRNSAHCAGSRDTRALRGLAGTGAVGLDGPNSRGMPLKKRGKKLPLPSMRIHRIRRHKRQLRS
jgi:hypothetical protein